MIQNNIKSYLAISGRRLTSLYNNYIILNVYNIVDRLSSIYDLDLLVRKGVRTKDGSDLGNVIAVDNTHINVRGKRIFKFPTQFIDLYVRSEVFLNIFTDELSIYKIY